LKNPDGKKGPAAYLYIVVVFGSYGQNSYYIGDLAQLGQPLKNLKEKYIHHEEKSVFVGAENIHVKFTAKQFLCWPEFDMLMALGDQPQILP
jgi:hypothetical protein